MLIISILPITLVKPGVFFMAVPITPAKSLGIFMAVPITLAKTPPMPVGVYNPYASS